MDNIIESIIDLQAGVEIIEIAKAITDVVFTVRGLLILNDTLVECEPDDVKNVELKLEEFRDKVYKLIGIDLSSLDADNLYNGVIEPLISRQIDNSA